jgi:transposase
MPQPNDLSRSLVALDQDSTISAVVEMSQSSWLVGGVLLGLLYRWRDEAVRAGKKITRIALAFEAGRDGFWLARWLSARGWRRTSSIPRVSQYRENIAGQRPTGWTPSC